MGIEAFEVSSALVLKDLMTPVLSKVAGEFTKFEAQLKGVQSQIGLVAKEFRAFKEANVELRGAAGATKTLNSELFRTGGLARTVSERMETIKHAGITRATTAVNTLNNAMKETRLTAATLGSAMTIGQMMPASAGHGNHGGGSRHNGFHGGNIHMGPNGMGMSSFGASLGDATPMLMGGAVIGWGLKSTLHPAVEYQGAVNRFKGLNLGDKVNADAERFANNQNLYGVNSIDMMNQLRDLHTVMGNYEHAKELAPLFARIQFANQAVYGEHGNKMDEKQLADLGRVIDMRNAWRSPEEMRRNADMMQHVVSGTGGMVLPSQYRLMMATGGVAAKNLAEESFYYAAEPIIQEMKSGSKFGTALMSAHQNLGMGRTTKRAAELLVDLGLLDEKNVLKSGFVAGTLKGEGLREKSPELWVNQVAVPAIKNYLEKHHQGITDAAIMNNLNAFMTNRTGSNLYGMYYQQYEKIQRAMRVDRGAMGIKQIETMADKSYAGNLEAFHKQWTEFRKEIGLIILPGATNFLHNINSELRSLTAWAKENPVKVRIMTGALVGLSGALLFGGTVKLLGVAFSGLASTLGFAGTVTGVSGALRGLGAASAMSQAGGAAGILRVAAALGPGGLVAAIIAVGGAVALTIKGIKAWREYNDKHLQHVPGTAKPDGFPKPIRPDKNHPNDGHAGPWGKAIADWWGKSSKPNTHVPDNRLGGYNPWAGATTMGRDLTPQGKNDKVSFNVPVYLDGRKIAEVVSDHQSRAMNRPQTGISSFDRTLGYSPVNI